MKMIVTYKTNQNNNKIIIVDFSRDNTLVSNHIKQIDNSFDAIVCMSIGYNSDYDFSNIIHNNPCKCCGEKFEKVREDSFVLKNVDTDMCFSCNVWSNRINEDVDNIIVVNNKYYTYHKYTTDSNTRFLGHGGRKFTFYKEIDNSIIESNNVWFGGYIPNHLINKFNKHKGVIIYEN